MAEHDRASSSGSSFTYDVFLNFRGEDTPNSFTALLHSALRKSEINVFMDSENLWVGEDIQPALVQAIRRSQISIAIFSEGYADCKRCLMELVEIVGCHRSNGQRILPIFLAVNPSDVGNQTGRSFKAAFQKHVKEFDAQVIESWKHTLTEVAEKKGYELKQVNGNQPQLINLLVDWVLSESRSNRLDEMKTPIGLDDHLQELLRLLKVDYDGIRLVGICGLGGIGKTTLARILYNRLFRSFEMSCFLANVREEESLGPNGVVSLQEKLIHSVSKKEVKIGDVDEGRQLIKKTLQRNKVLLILDDVSSCSQLEALAIETNVFGPGSRIIITSRDRHILHLAKVDQCDIYEPCALNCEQSLQLFSLHAFSSDQPPEDYTQLSHEVVNLTGGLPLALEVLGSTLCGIREKEAWESVLLRLKGIPNHMVQYKLRLSYDNLNDKEKRIFLDAACYFNGWKKKTVISIWDACGFEPITSIKKLIQMSLLKFTSDEWNTCDERLRMHDLIQDMGREIVHSESRLKPSNRSRLFSRVDTVEALEEPKRTQLIEGIVCSPIQPRWRMDFAMMPRLRFLYMNGVYGEGDFRHLPSNLRWFSWWGCTVKIPANFFHEELVYMNLSNSLIRQAWTNKPQIEGQHFQKLKVLRLRFCRHQLESPDFSWFPHLETLDLGCCKRMFKLHKSIGDLKYLVKLYLDDTKIDELPKSVCQLSSLQFLTLSFCSSLQNLPESIGDLKSLVTLSLDGTKIEQLPNSICRLSSLRFLTLSWCSSFKNLPESVGDLKSLVVLSLDGTAIEELPNSICRSNTLQKLNLNWCSSIENLPQSIDDLESLVELSIRGTKIKRLPNDAGWLEKIESFYIGWKGNDF